MFVVAVYVDDIILGGKNESILHQVKEELSKKFDMKDLRTITSLPGCNSNSGPTQ